MPPNIEVINTSIKLIFSNPFATKAKLSGLLKADVITPTATIFRAIAASAKVESL